MTITKESMAAQDSSQWSLHDLDLLYKCESPTLICEALIYPVLFSLVGTSSTRVSS